MGDTKQVSIKEHVIRARLQQIEVEGANHELALIETEAVRDELEPEQYDKLVADHQKELTMLEKRRAVLVQELDKITEGDTDD